MIHRLLRSSWCSAKCVLAQPRLSRNQCSSSLATFVYGHRRICRHRRKGMARQIQHRRRDDTQRQNVPSDKPPVLLCRYDWQNFGQSDRLKGKQFNSLDRQRNDVINKQNAFLQNFITYYSFLLKKKLLLQRNKAKKRTNVISEKNNIACRFNTRSKKQVAF